MEVVEVGGVAMLSGKSLAFSAVGALAPALVWFVLMWLTGWSLWLLAPIVGAGAAYGMIRATQMGGGRTAGLSAAGIAVVVILTARSLFVGHWVSTQVEDLALASLTSALAAEMEARNERAFEGNRRFKPEVRQRATETWKALPKDQRAEYLSAIRKEYAEFEGWPTGLRRVFHVGLAGLVVIGLAGLGAFRLASLSLEEALVQRGLADAATTELVAAQMRANCRAEVLARDFWLRWPSWAASRTRFGRGTMARVEEGRCSKAA
jgi:hypothetical protein